MMAKTVMRPKGVRHARQRLPQMRSQQVLVGDIVRHFPQPVHIIREAEEPCWDLWRQPFEGPAHHRRAHNFRERPNMRESRRAIASLEQHVSLLGCRSPQTALQELSSFLERPGSNLEPQLLNVRCHGVFPDMVCQAMLRCRTLRLSCARKPQRSVGCRASAAGVCYAAPDSSEDPLRTSTILPVTPPFPSNSCAYLASTRGNRCAMSGLICRCCRR